MRSRTRREVRGSSIEFISMKDRFVNNECFFACVRLIAVDVDFDVGVVVVVEVGAHGQLVAARVIVTHGLASVRLHVVVVVTRVVVMVTGLVLAVFAVLLTRVHLPVTLQVALV